MTKQSHPKLERPSRLCASMLVLATFLALPARGAQDSPNRIGGEDVLWEIFGRGRPTGGRWSLFDDYVPYSGDGPLLEASDLPELARIETALERRMSLEVSSRTFRERALVLLFQGDTGGASELLREASRIFPDDASVGSDLAAAYLARASRENDPSVLVHALGAALRARRSDASHLGALYNAAEVASRLSLTRVAASFWRDYLASEPEPAWRNEAQEALERVARPGKADDWESWKRRLDRDPESLSDETLQRIVESHAGSAREYIEVDILGTWGESIIAGDAARAETMLMLASRVAGIASRVLGDHLLADAVETIRRVEKDPAGALALAKAHHEYTTGRRLYESRSFTSAASSFGRSESAFSVARSPMKNWANRYRAACVYQRGAHDEARRSFQASIEDVADQPYVSLRATLLWSRGMTYLADGAREHSIRDLSDAATLFRAVREDVNSASMDTLIALSLEYAGDSRRAWSHRLRAAPLLAEAGQLGPWMEVWSSAAESALTAGEPEAAVLFHDAILGRIARTPDHMNAALYFTKRGIICLQVAVRDCAARDLKAAKARLRHITDPITRERVAAEVAVLEGALLASERPRDAIPLLDAALERLGRSRHVQTANPIDLLMNRAAARERLGDEAGAIADLERSVAEAEEQMRISGRELRRYYFGEASKPYGRLAVLLSKRGDAASAFEYADRERRLMLWSQGTGTEDSQLPSRPFDSLALTGALEDGEAVVEFQLVEAGLLGFVVTRQGIRLNRSRWTGAAVERRLRSILARFPFVEGDALDELLAELYVLVLKDLEPALAEARRIVVIPDGLLSQIPFAALRDHEGRYLAERWVVSVSPDAATYLERAAAHDAIGKVGALVIANPTLPRAHALDYPSLESAEESAGAIARVYPRGEVLLGPGATKRAVLERLADHNVVHIAAHTELDDEGAPQVVLASSRGEEASFLRGHEVGSLPLERGSLVVLAACQTATASEIGNLPLVWPWLRAGAGGVVATLWSVDDELASRLMTSFHRHFRATGDAAEALRASQTELIHAESPKAWGAFAFYGRAAMTPWN